MIKNFGGPIQDSYLFTTPLTMLRHLIKDLKNGRDDYHTKDVERWGKTRKEGRESWKKFGLLNFVVPSALVRGKAAGSGIHGLNDECLDGLFIFPHAPQAYLQRGLSQSLSIALARSARQSHGGIAITENSLR